MTASESQPGRRRPDNSISRRSLRRLARGVIPISPDVIGGPYKNVIGDGIDIVEVSWIEKVLQADPRFLPNVLTDDEITHCQSHGRKTAQHFAGYFALKEAVYKVLQETPEGAWHEIHIEHNKQGAPKVRLEGKVKERADSMGIEEMKVSITHVPSAAVAICIGVGSS